MSSPPPSSSYSSSSSSSDEDGGIGGGAYTRRGGDFEGPSSSRRRAMNEVWPEPFVEALAEQIAVYASRTFGRLAAASALATLFQVCSTWRAVSRSDLLWRRLTERVWGRTHLLRATWQDEYIYWHRTASNFRRCRYSYFCLHFDPSDVDNPDGLTCRCLTLSDHYLAAGYADGTVRLFDLATRLHIRTFRPQHCDRLGRFSRAVSGIIITDLQLVFATLDGGIHVAVFDDVVNPPETVHFGNVVENGVLVDFAGSERYWVGLYAGVAGRAFHIWDNHTQQILEFGSVIDQNTVMSLTDQNTVMGWRMLAEFTDFVGRVRVTNQHLAVACTSTRVMVFDLINQGVVLRDVSREVVVTSVDVSNGTYIVVDGRGIATVRRADTSRTVCRFRIIGAREVHHVMGSMNLGYALMCAEGIIRVWEIERDGQYLYRLRERVGAVNAFVADNRHVAASDGSGIHIWDFEAQ